MGEKEKLIKMIEKCEDDSIICKIYSFVVMLLESKKD